MKSTFEISGRYERRLRAAKRRAAQSSGEPVVCFCAGNEALSGEIRKGIERLRSQDGIQAEVLEMWLSAVKDAFTGRILPVDDDVSEAWGRLNAARPLPAVDSFLAATAKIYNLTLVTRNTKQLADLSVDLLNPFET